MEELKQAYRDIDFLLESSQIGMVFLDGQLRIRRFNKAIQKHLNIMQRHLGRPLTDITFRVGEEDLNERVSEAVHSKGHWSREVTTDSGVLMVKILPFDSRQNTAISFDTGVVVCLIDVTGVKEMERLAKFDEESAALVDDVSHGLRKPLERLEVLLQALVKQSSLQHASASQASEAHEILASVKQMIDTLLNNSGTRKRIKNKPTSGDVSESCS